METPRRDVHVLVNFERDGAHPLDVGRAIVQASRSDCGGVTYVHSVTVFNGVPDPTDTMLSGIAELDTWLIFKPAVTPPTYSAKERNDYLLGVLTTNMCELLTKCKASAPTPNTLVLILTCPDQQLSYTYVLEVFLLEYKTTARIEVWCDDCDSEAWRALAEKYPTLSMHDLAPIRSLL